MISTAQELFEYIPVPEPDRVYYVDVYTGKSVLSYETPEILSAIAVVSRFVHPAQCISFYSYKQDPYKYRSLYNNH